MDTLSDLLDKQHKLFYFLSDMGENYFKQALRKYIRQLISVNKFLMDLRNYINYID